MRLLADTHVLVRWIVDEKKLSRRQRQALKRVGASSPLLVSDITLWEIAALVELGRLRLPLGLRDWLEYAVAPPLVERHGITPQVAAEVAALPSSFHRDPADRIIVATARVAGATLLTSDERIVDAELVATIA